MDAANYIKTRLTGAIETALFIPDGVGRFSGTPRETLISFSILLVSLPLSYLSIIVHPPIGTEAFAAGHIFLVHFLSGIVSFTFGLAMLYGFARFVTGGNTDRIWLFYTMSNWLGFLFMPLGLLFMALRHYGIFEPKTMEDATLVLTLYGYGIGGYMIYRIFKPPVEFAIALICFSLVMGQIVLKGAYTLGGLPNVDYMERYGPSAVQEAAQQQETAEETPPIPENLEEPPSAAQELMEN